MMEMSAQIFPGLNAGVPGAILGQVPGLSKTARISGRRALVKMDAQGPDSYSPPAQLAFDFDLMDLVDTGQYYPERWTPVEMAPSVAAVVEDLTSSTSIHFLDAGPKSCRFPLWADDNLDDATWKICGAARVSLSSYCECHDLLAYGRRKAS